jgi:primosomal protein N' (replication factor Y)
MFALVRLLNGFEMELTYKVPQTLVSVVLPGVVVRVPLRNQLVSALVLKLLATAENCGFEIKEIIELEDVPADTAYNEFIKKLAQFYFLPSLHFYQRIRSFLNDKKIIEELVTVPEKEATPKVYLTDEQEAVVEYVKKFIYQPAYAPTLLHGVTGSGKTEVYKELVQIAVAKGKTVLLMLPEVSLALQFQVLLSRQMPNITVIGFHSATKLKDKRILWQMLLDKVPMLIIGVHLPILLPIANLGLIIVDEEHEQGFLEKKHPKINSKDVALWRASIYKIPILLGSATPSVNSLFNVKKHGWGFFEIKKRFAGCFPKLNIVPLISASSKKRKYFWVTDALKNAISECLKLKHQAIIYINRRGFSFFVQCRQCGFIFECPNCSVSLTLHFEREGQLRCHHCDFKKTMPKLCPQCHADDKNLLKKGIGTQQAVQALSALFPQAVIERADLDTTSKKREWENTVKQFEEGAIDILVGTQTITKGYHFPGVTLVGILWADLNLHFPTYNASETTLQQLIQVAGRAGRLHEESQVVVQVMQPEHQIFNYLNEQDYIKFCDLEMEMRSQTNYPPYGRLVQLELKHSSAKQVHQDAESLSKCLHGVNNDNNLNITILGPALPIISKIQNYEIRQIFLKSQSFGAIVKLINSVDLHQFESAVFVVSNV